MLYSPCLTEVPDWRQNKHNVSSLPILPRLKRNSKIKVQKSYNKQRKNKDLDTTKITIDMIVHPKDITKLWSITIKKQAGKQNINNKKIK